MVSDSDDLLFRGREGNACGFPACLARISGKVRSFKFQNSYNYIWDLNLL